MRVTRILQKILGQYSFTESGEYETTNPMERASSQTWHLVSLCPGVVKASSFSAFRGLDEGARQ